jgi:hypothetical protein
VENIYSKIFDCFDQSKRLLFHDVIIQCSISQGFTEEINRLLMAFTILLQKNCCNSVIKGKRKLEEIFCIIGVDKHRGLCQGSFHLIKGMFFFYGPFYFCVFFQHICYISKKFCQVRDKSS